MCFAFLERPPSVDNAKIQELQKHLDEALVAKGEAEAKLTKLIGAVKGGGDGKLDPSLVSAFDT